MMQNDTKHTIYSTSHQDKCIQNLPLLTLHYDNQHIYNKIEKK
jgi:hypothetical protein